MCSKSAVIYLPVVRANAFIGIDEFRERKRTIIEDAVRLNRKRSFASSTLDDAFIQNQLTGKKRCLSNGTSTTINEKKKSDESSPLVRCQSVIGMELLTRNYQTSPALRYKHEVRKEIRRPKQNIEKVLNTAIIYDDEPSSTLLRCKSVIGSELLSGEKCPDEGVLKSESASTADNHASDPSSSALVRCNSVMGFDLISENGSQPGGAVLSPATPSLMGKNSFSTRYLAKSKQMATSMTRDRLMRMEKAIKEWNARFGTHYTLL